MTPLVSLSNLNVGSSTVSLRPAAPPDQPFLLRLYASTRAEELASVPWPAEVKEQFLRSQFAAQDRAYRMNYPGAEFLVVQIDGCDAGRLYLHDQPEEIRVIDISLLPEYRGKRCGAALLASVLSQARHTHRRVTLHVEASNRAWRLYERLGFRRIAQPSPLYALLEWRP